MCKGVNTFHTIIYTMRRNLHNKLTKKNKRIKYRKTNKRGGVGSAEKKKLRAERLAASKKKVSDILVNFNKSQNQSRKNINNMFKKIQKYDDAIIPNLEELQQMNDPVYDLGAAEHSDPAYAIPDYLAVRSNSTSPQYAELGPMHVSPSPPKSGYIEVQPGSEKIKPIHKTENVIYISKEFSKIRTSRGDALNLNNRICMVEIPSKNERIYFKLINETATSFSGIRLQQDQYNNKKFYLTGEKNKWHGIISDGAFAKGRWIYVFNNEQVRAPDVKDYQDDERSEHKSPVENDTVKTKRRTPCPRGTIFNKKTGDCVPHNKTKKSLGSPNS